MKPIMERGQTRHPKIRIVAPLRNSNETISSMDFPDGIELSKDFSEKEGMTMADVHKYYEQFHETIKLKRFDENKTLREKRDAVLDKLKTRMKELFDEREQPVPSYECFNQGSYEMGTGVKPLDSDYDIDVGLMFEVAVVDYSDPVEVKKWVYDSLEGHTKRVEMRRPCVTVFYQKESEPIYHVDLAIYSEGSCNGDGKDYLAKGKLSSSEEHRIWEEANPKELIKLIKNRFKGEDGNQFRRTIRYLKRWKDVKFTSNGNAAPIGMGITVAAYYWFSVHKDLVDAFQGKYQYNDHKALKQLVDSTLGQFSNVYHDGEWAERLKVALPVQPGLDLFSKMTNQQMKAFKEKLENLFTVLQESEDEVDPVESCKKLKKEFGDDFPVPEKNETAQKKAPAIVSSSSSA